ncbi:MAG: hypothetical protein LBB56_08290 [Chitinispirillales bacterium]|jgi:hypothetical protein|nr:hypothetical protein [Chitinispirillales bacterium]
MDVTAVMNVITGIFNLDSLPALLSGFAAGAAVICFLWMIAAASRKSKLNKQKDEREKLMFAIGELIADADTISADFRCGGLKWELFSKRLSNKVNEITRELRTNMHLFDVFFVKYVEIQANQYLTVIENPERRGAQKSEGAAASDTGLRFTPVPDSAPAPEAAAEVQQTQQTAVPAEKAEKSVVIEEAAFDAIPAEAENVQQAEYAPEPLEVEKIGQVPEEAEASAAAEEVEFEDLPEDFSPVEEPPALVIPAAAEQVSAAVPEQTAEAVEELSTDEEEFELGAAAQNAPAAVSAVPVEQEQTAAPVDFAAPAAFEPEPEIEPEPEPEPEPEQDTWSEKSIEEYEAGFAQFEETGYFQISRVEDEQSAAAPEQAAVPPPVIAPAVEPPPVISAPVISAPVVSAAAEDDEEEFIVEHNQYTVPNPRPNVPKPDISVPNVYSDQILTETVCIDRVPLAPPPAAPIVPAVPIAPPVMAPVPAAPAVPIAPSVMAPVPVPVDTVVSAVPSEDNQEDGITGDDVMDSIDSFFNLK